MDNDFVKKSLDENTSRNIKIKIELSNKDYFKMYLLWICKGLTIIIIMLILLLIWVDKLWITF